MRMDVLKKALLITSRALAVLFSFAFALLSVATTLTGNHVDTVSTALGQNIVNTVYVDTDDDEENTDADYYKSAFESVAQVRAAGFDYTQQIMEEGAVLLRNNVCKDGKTALPLAAGTKVTLYGSSSAKPTISGYREKDKNEGVVSFKDGLEYAGLDVNDKLFEWYKNSSYGKKSIFGHDTFANAYTIGEAPWSALPADSRLPSGYKTAVYVISRIAGEATDVQVRNLGEASKGFDGKKGNYLILSENEEDMLANLKACKDSGALDKIIVIMNTTNQVACDFEDKYDVDALLYSGSIGSAGTKGIGNILAGKVNPSGKLSDTFWKNHYLNPVLANWGPASYNSSNNTYAGFSYDNDGTACVVYQEGIYSGYRYTETRYEDVVLKDSKVGDYVYNDVVAYPFGYGLSYSDFEYSDFDVKYNSETDAYDVSVKVINNGVKGKHSVQLFLQKPYTSYDKEKGIEKASVELVDFAKTAELENGDDETVYMSVPRRELASYDSYGERTYILEAGKYYFAVGTDAHDALNNIIAQKVAEGVSVNADKIVDVTGAKTEGNTANVKRIDIGDDLLKAYTKAVNGKGITNNFDNVDLKLYSAAGNNKDKFNYITRSDWEGTVVYGYTADGTFLNKYARITLTDAMKTDMNKGVEKGTGNMPTMGSTETSWQLIDLMNDDEGKPLPYDDPKWDQLLNQLTWDDMEYLLSNGYSTTRVLESVSKPKTFDQDSDLGVILSYNADGKGLASRLADPDKGKKPAAYTDNGITAATRNKELLHDYGVQWGEDCLWAGYQGLYGTGANIHRSPYLGRSYGYYSEDGILMGKCIAQINIGMEEKGSFMLLKHCMLNEQETSRIAGSSWANEQTIREVYLKPFQVAIEEGGVQGVMTSLNRLGVVAAPHHPFINDVLRGEFGMQGYCVTDSYMSHMNIASCLVAGNDLPLDQDSSLGKYKDYPNVAWAMRNAAHNILYTVVHSNGMNGATSNSRFIRFQPEWQYHLERATPAALSLMIIALAFLVAMEVWSYFGNGKRSEPKEQAPESNVE